MLHVEIETVCVKDNSLKKKNWIYNYNKKIFIISIIKMGNCDS